MKNIIKIFAAALLLSSCVNLDEEKIYGIYEYKPPNNETFGKIILIFEKSHVLKVEINSKYFITYYWVVGNNADGNIGFSIFKNEHSFKQKKYLADGVYKIDFVEIGSTEKEFTALIENKTPCIFNKK